MAIGDVPTSYCGDPANIFVALDELLEVARRPAWHADAACRGLGERVNFFPGAFESDAAAKAVCARCRVRRECSAAGFEEPVGVWGGNGQIQRTRHRGVIVSSGAEIVVGAS